jgi:hypothetical protein
MARQQKEFRWIAVAMKIAIAAAIQRWLNSCLDFGLLMGVALAMLQSKVRVAKTLLGPTMKKTPTPRTALAAGVAKVLQRLHYPLDVMFLCVRWYVAYSLGRRNLER